MARAQQEEVPLQNDDDSTHASQSFNTKGVPLYWRRMAILIAGLACTALVGGGGGRVAFLLKRYAQRPIKVTVFASCGEVGRAVALHLNTHLPGGSTLALHDARGGWEDVHACAPSLDRNVHVEVYAGGEGYDDALIGSDVVLIAGVINGIPFKSSMDRSDLFNLNAPTVKFIAGRIAVMSPNALVAVVMEPVNVLVPMVAEVMKRAGVYNERKLFGVSSSPMVAASLVAGLKDMDPLKIHVPVVGGTTGTTITPIFSQIEGVNLNNEEIDLLTKKIQWEAKGCDVQEFDLDTEECDFLTSPQTVAEAASRFALSLVAALGGETNILQQAYVASSAEFSFFFFHTISLGPEGVEEVLPIGDLSDSERQHLDSVLKAINTDITQGEHYAD